MATIKPVGLTSLISSDMLFDVFLHTIPKKNPVVHDAQSSSTLSDLLMDYYEHVEGPKVSKVSWNLETHFLYKAIGHYEEKSEY